MVFHHHTGVPGLTHEVLEVLEAPRVLKLIGDTRALRNVVFYRKRQEAISAPAGSDPDQRPEGTRSKG